MSDYRIIVEVHKRGGAKDAPTIPDSSTTDKPTKPRKKTKDDDKTSLYQIASAVRNPAGALTKLVAGGAIGTAVIVASRTAMEITENVIDISATINGDYSRQIAFNNFKAMTSFVSRPISSTISAFKRQIAIDNTNKRQALNRELMGNADLGGNDRRGG